MHSGEITLESVSKVEGHAKVEVKVRDGKVEHARYEIAEAKRFYTRSIEGKPAMAVPQLLSRICGTCSNAHQMTAIEACEAALGIEPTEQTMVLRHLVQYGLNVRDHALHLYLFVMPDLYGKDNFLAFDENNEEEHQHLHDCFEIKAAGNQLAKIVAGRSIHATYATVGGFVHFPSKEEVEEAVAKLEACRPAVLRLIDTFAKCDFKFDRQTNYMALVPEGNFWFMDGDVVTSQGERYDEKRYRELLEHVVLPYSTASAYEHGGEAYMVGSLARLNLAKDTLHDRTKESIPEVLEMFPSTNIYHNNLAQAVEILHSLDHAVELLKKHDFAPEELVKPTRQEGMGIGVTEAPRGTLYHRVETDEKGLVKKGEVIVPTGQNQRNIEADLAVLVEKLLADGMEQEAIVYEMEKLIRAYDPCMSCATHFLKVKWDVA